MTLSVYISRDTATNGEKGFEHPFERFAALQAAKMLWRHYEKSQTHFALVANIETPPIDVVIISNNGMGIVDLKDYSSQVGGKDNAPWFIFDKQGNPTTQLKSGVHLNPFEQVKTYRKRVYGRLRGFVEQNPKLMPPWLIRDSYGIQGAVVFTAQKFDITRIIIDPSVGRPWFSLKWLDEISEWAYSLEFGRGHKLTRTQIETLATKFLGTEPWVEIEGHLESKDPYGYLWVIVDGKEAWPLILDQDEMIVGRSPDVSLMLDPSSYPLVSRQHAVIRRSANTVIITDIESKHGTWVNGERTNHISGQSLKNGDRVILGTLNDQKEAGNGACTLIYKSIYRRVEVTASEEIR